MQLNYKQFGTGFPVIILHGLLGSLDNWQTVAKKLSVKYKVFIVDQRNHGRSPHSAEFSYGLLSEDVLQFMEQHRLPKVHLIGHSMGGKVAMHFALRHPLKVEKLVVVDIAPVAYDDRHSDVFKALYAANVEVADTREEVEAVLRQYLEDEGTVQFLMKNLYREMVHGGFRWKFNLDVLHARYAEISAPGMPAATFTGPVLFIKGERSNYLEPESFDAATRLFPHNQLTEIKGAGHWVHADKPNEFTNEVMDFLA